MQIRRALSVFLVLFLLPLAGCVVSDRDLFAGEFGATPLPDAFILFAQDRDEPDGGYVYRDGDYYVVLEEDDAEVYRLVQLSDDYFVAIDRDDDGLGANYGLIEITDNELLMVGVDSDWLAEDQNLKTDNPLPIFNFDSRDELLAMFSRAAKEAENRPEWKTDKPRFRIYDFADPQQKAEGEKLVAEARTARAARRDRESGEGE